MSCMSCRVKIVLVAALAYYDIFIALKTKKFKINILCCLADYSAVNLILNGKPGIPTGGKPFSKEHPEK